MKQFATVLCSVLYAGVIGAQALEVPNYGPLPGLRRDVSRVLFLIFLC